MAEVTEGGKSWVSAASMTKELPLPGDYSVTCLGGSASSSQKGAPGTGIWDGDSVGSSGNRRQRVQEEWAAPWDCSSSCRMFTVQSCFEMLGVAQIPDSRFPETVVSAK